MDVSHGFVAVILPLALSGEKTAKQSLWCATAKGYAETGTFYVTSITLFGVRFTLLTAIGILSPKEVTPITILRVSSSQLSQIGRCSVTLKHELLLDNPYKVLKDTDDDATAENGGFGVNATVSDHLTLDHIAQNYSLKALGARLPRLSGGMGRNIMGAKKAPSELARTGGASLCHLSKRDVVKAVPLMKSVKRFSVALFSDVALMRTVSLWSGSFVVEVPQQRRQVSPRTLWRRSGADPLDKTVRVTHLQSWRGFLLQGNPSKIQGLPLRLPQRQAWNRTMFPAPHSRTANDTGSGHRHFHHLKVKGPGGRPHFQGLPN